MLFQVGHKLNVGRKFTDEQKQRIRERLMINHPTRGLKFGSSNWLRVENPNLYRNLHKWVNRRLGKAKVCRVCESQNWVEWANVDNRYRKDLNDYIPLCRSCHHKRDAEYRRNVTMDEDKYKEITKNG